MSAVHAERLALLSAQVEALSTDLRHYALRAVAARDLRAEAVALEEALRSVASLEDRLQALRLEVAAVRTDAADCGGLPC